MIRETLKVLGPGAHTLAGMADQLGIGIEDLRHRLTLLEEKGLIHKITGEDCCPSGCNRCHGCSKTSSPLTPTYELTDKGRRMLGSA